MKTVTWKGKGKVPEVQNGISNPGRNVRKGQVMETKQEGEKKKPTPTNQPKKTPQEIRTITMRRLGAQ